MKKKKHNSNEKKLELVRPEAMCNTKEQIYTRKSVSGNGALMPQKHQKCCPSQPNGGVTVLLVVLVVSYLSFDELLNHFDGS